MIISYKENNLGPNLVNLRKINKQGTSIWKF